MPKYLDEYPFSLTLGHGLVYTLSDIDSIPWCKLSSSEKTDIERLYATRSGLKTLSPSFMAAEIDARARILAMLFSQKWTRLWNTFALEYDALDAYIVTESGTRHTNHEDSDTMKYGRTVTEQGTNTGTIDTEGSDDSNNTDSVYGFNSPLAVPSDSGTEHIASAGKETRNLASSKNLTNSGQDEKENNGNETEEYSYTKKGNIGYSTPQTLLQQEFELWKTPFFNIVFDDIDSFIALSVFD